MSRFDYASGIGLCMKSLYGNIYYPDAPCLAEQKKTVFKSYTLDELNLRFEKPILLSFNDQGLMSFLIGAAHLGGGTQPVSIFLGPEFLKRPSQVS